MVPVENASRGSRAKPPRPSAPASIRPDPTDDLAAVLPCMAKMRQELQQALNAYDAVKAGDAQNSNINDVASIRQVIDRAVANSAAAAGASSAAGFGALSPVSYAQPTLSSRIRTAGGTPPAGSRTTSQPSLTMLKGDVGGGTAAARSLNFSLEYPAAAPPQRTQQRAA
jgi:hypothetical protein